MLACLGLSAVASAQPTHNYLPFKMMNTAANPFLYLLDARDPNPKGLTLSNVEAATQRAWQQWDALSCAATAFSYQGPTSSAIADPRDNGDTFNVSTVWIQQSADPYYAYALGSSPDIAAVSLPLTYAGVLEQCDIYLNGVDHPWTTATGVGPGQLDVESIILHESGHCQGLDHSSYSPSEVMYPEVPLGQAKRVLSTYDIDTLCARYPSAGAVGSPCLSDGGCGGKPDAGLACVVPPGADGGTGIPFCTVGCPLGQNFACEIPYLCLASNAFAPTANGACLPPGNHVTQVGKPCASNAACGSSTGLCQPPSTLPSGYPSWEGGYCTQDCGANQPSCPAGAVCLDVGGGTMRCLKECRVGSGDCRQGYTCVLPSVGGPGLCEPSCHIDADCSATEGSTALCRPCDGTCLRRQNPLGEIGSVCSDSSSCGSGQVCTRFSDGGPGICSQACARACTPCPSASSCHPVGDRGELYCLRDCDLGTCPAGLQCSQLESGKGCMPPCASDLDCAVGTTCLQGQCQSSTPRPCLLCPPGSDGGSGSHSGSDGGTAATPGPGGGCGCGTGSNAVGWAMGMAALMWKMRRARTWR